MSDLNTIFQNGVKAVLSGGNLSIEANPDNDTLNITGDGHLAVANKDAAANVASLRTLGTGAQQASAGSHTHALSALTQSGAASGQVPKWNGTAWTPQNESNGLSAPGMAAVADIPWVRWFKADALTGLSDGDPVAYWVNSAAILTPATQALADNRPIYKTNIVNGQPVVRFDGVNDYMRTLGGGTSLVGAFYMAVVGSPSRLGTYQHVVCLGEETTGKRRSMLLWGETTMGVLNSLTFNGQSADVRPPQGTPAVTTGAVYLWEIYYDGALVHIAQNGKLLAILPPNAALATFTSAPITLGAGNDASNPFGGDIAEVLLLGSAPTGEQLATVRSYLATKYALSLAANVSSAGVSGSASSVRKLSDDGARTVIDMPLTIGLDQPLKTDGVANVSMNSARYPALLSMIGALVADCVEQGDHLLMSRSPNQGVLCLWNRTTNGFSSIRFLDFNGLECGAFGWANPGLTPWGSADGNMMLELSNFTDVSKGGQFRLVQTGTINGGGNGSYLRWEWKSNGDCVWYDLSGAAIFTIHPSGAVTFAPRTAPSSPTEGATYYDSAAHKLKVYTGSAWETVTSA